MAARTLALWVTLGWAASVSSATAVDRDARQRERDRMIETIERYARSSEREIGAATLEPRVLEVLLRVPRHEFVPEDVRGEAYADRPLPIGFGQTISQPFIVALMTHLIRPEPDDVVLEVGTGSGYQAAVLSPLVKQVKTIEVVPALAESAGARLARLGCANVETRRGDGYDGWPEGGAFDAIVVTAAASQVPPPLVAQLKPGGHMILPVGGPFSLQYLVLIEKHAGGTLTTRQIMPVAFVPLVRAP